MALVVSLSVDGLSEAEILARAKTKMNRKKCETCCTDLKVLREKVEASKKNVFVMGRVWDIKRGTMGTTSIVYDDD